MKYGCPTVKHISLAFTVFTFLAPAFLTPHTNAQSASDAKPVLLCVLTTTGSVTNGPNSVLVSDAMTPTTHIFFCDQSLLNQFLGSECVVVSSDATGKDAVLVSDGAVMSDGVLVSDGGISTDSVTSTRTNGAVRRIVFLDCFTKPISPVGR